jgi:hypothetical protein
MSTETKTAFTPGPWKLGNTSPGRLIILGGSSSRYVCTVQVHQTPRGSGVFSEPEREANAHLIAAAPALLEALRDLLDSHFDMSPLQYAASRGLEMMSDVEGDRILENARAVIRKATEATP